MRAAGANVDLAPVADVARPGSVLAGQGRTFGTTAAAVAGAAAAFAGGLREAGVAATAKHFPGLGAATETTDAAAVRITVPARRLRSVDMAPFAALIRRHVPLVMLGTAVYPSLDPDAPAALSRPIATGQLRDRLGFDGVTVTDALDTPGPGAVRRAGGGRGEGGRGGQRHGPLHRPRERRGGGRRPARRHRGPPGCAGGRRGRRGPRPRPARAPAMIRPVSTTGLRDVTFDEALAVVRAQALDLPAEPVALEELAGRVLAEDVLARGDHPAFTNSAMDGYAVRAADAAGGGALRLVGESRAGAPYAGTVCAGEAVRISTGGELPEGADAILRVEDAAEEGEGTPCGRPSPPEPGTFVRRRGEDVRVGQPLLFAGQVVGPHEVAVVAGAGHARVLCARRPRVAVVGSGDEVVPAGEELGPGQVYDANRPGVAAQAEAAGARVVARAVVPDDLRATIAAIGGILDGRDAEAPDLLVTTGGVSVGRHDHLRPALDACGVGEVLYGVEIRPGHPLWLGRRGAQLVLGLPGNPVSAAVCFHVFGRPLLGRGDPWSRRMPMAERYVKPTPRTELVRCVEVDGALRPLPRQGSHAITSLAGATHLAAVDAERREVAAGEEVRAAPLV